MPSGSGFAPGPSQLAGWTRLRLTELGANRPFRLRRQTAARPGRLHPIPLHQQVVGTSVRRLVAVVGAVVLEEIAHLVQPRVDAEADPRLETFRVAVVGCVLVVRR